MRKLFLVACLLISFATSAQRYYAEMRNDTVFKVIVCSEAHGTGYIETFIGNPTKKYACIGDTYDSSHKAFMSKKPYSSWYLDVNFQWVAPIGKPSDSLLYQWNDTVLRWDLVPGSTEIK